MQPIESAGSIAIVSISPFADDHSAVRSIARNATWVLFEVDRLSAAHSILREHPISVVICERDLCPGSWTDVLEALHELRHPPALVVTSGLADERLWCEVLNLGGWDVLAKPFDSAEVARTTESAARHWRNSIQAAQFSARAAG